MKKIFSSLKIKDLDCEIESMCPIRIYINDFLVWDDDIDSLDKYSLILDKEDIVSEIRFEIVQFHHSIVYITTE